jgi:primary-amine oxidase
LAVLDAGLERAGKGRGALMEAGDGASARGFGVVLDRVANKTYEGVADLKSWSVISWKLIPGVQPAFRDVEFGQQMEIVRANPEWQAAMRRRGITNFWDAAIIPWDVGHYPTKAPKDARLNRVMSFCGSHLPGGPLHHPKDIRVIL